MKFRVVAIAVIGAIMLRVAGNCTKQVEANPMTEKKLFGKMPDGTELCLYTLANKNGMEAAITSFGATLVSLKVADRNGKFADVVLGYDTLEEYAHSS